MTKILYHKIHSNTKNKDNTATKHNNNHSHNKPQTMSSIVNNTNSNTNALNHSEDKHDIIATNSTNSSGISLCIPFVQKYIRKEKIFAVLVAQNVGFIERIDIVEKEYNKTAFVHFAKNEWANHPNNYQKATDILLNLKAGIPWIVPHSLNGFGFWKIWISNVPRKINTNNLTIPKQMVSQVPRVKRRQCVDLSSNTLESDYKQESKHEVEFDLNDPIQARMYASIPAQYL